MNCWVLRVRKRSLGALNWIDIHCLETMSGASTKYLQITMQLEVNTFIQGYHFQNLTLHLPARCIVNLKT